MIEENEVLNGTNPLPEYATPNPHPSRAVYGFAFFLCSWLVLPFYIAWAFIPTPWLKALHITYVPAKYWAIAVPLLFPVFVTGFVLAVFSINLIRFHGIFDNVAVIEHDFGDLSTVDGVDLRQFLERIDSSSAVSANDPFSEGKFGTSVISKTERLSRSTKVRQKSIFWSFRSELVVATRCLSRRERRRVERSLTRGIPNSVLMTRIRTRMEDVERDLQMHKSSSPDTPESTLDSLAAQHFFKKHAEDYCSLSAQKKGLSIPNERNIAVTSDGSPLELPLEGRSLPRESLSCGLKNANTEENSCTMEHKSLPDSLKPDVSAIDRGFYVEASLSADEYIAGTTFDIPDNEMEDETLCFGESDAVEVIDFQRPHQSTSSKETSLVHSDDNDSNWFSNYGTADPAFPVSEKSCFGCGAKFHCKDPSLPGFLPLELYASVDLEKDCSTTLCRRCYLLKQHNFLVNMNVCDVDYREMMQHLKLKQEALILLIVDMTDLPFSFYSGLSNIIGDRKPMIVIGNKVDLLPPDYRSGYLRHFRDVLVKSCDEMGFSRAFNILHYALLSAKTGFGVEDLITHIHLKWASKFGSLRNDIYLVGCTNAGKSTLFNTFLQSDLCKVRAVDLVERATTSIWPGTTISLLKFPVMKISPYKLEIRRRRLLASRKWEYREAKMRLAMLRETGDLKYAVLQANVMNSYKDKEEDLQPISVLDIRKQDRVASSFIQEKEAKRKSWDPNDKVFADGNWCFDTPGTVSSDQVLNLFTLDELMSVIPRKIIIPRTFIVHAKETLLIGGVAQLNVLRVTGQGTDAVLLSVFTNASLPVNVMKTSTVKAFLQKYFGTQALMAPCGDPQRISRFPKLESKQFEVQSLAGDIGAADVVLSSFGWICITAQGGVVQIEAFTPGARGLTLRTPPMMPFCAHLRGRRIAGTAAYKVLSSEMFLNDNNVGLKKPSNR